MAVRSGLEVMLDQPPDVLRGQRLGLLCNAASVDRDLRLAADLLFRAAVESPRHTGERRGAARPGRGSARPPRKGQWQLTHLLAPEHGLRGELPGGAPVPDATDSITGLPITSLYGERYRPDAAHLADVDVLVVDVMQVGARFYTRLWITMNCVEACAQLGRPVVILDRPNPIGGVAVEGPLLAPEHQSIIGRAGWPIRHGLTLGELVLLANQKEGIGADVHVVRVEGWQRAQWWDQTGLPWIMPSPAMPTLDTATVYPGTCLLERAVLTEGRGTTRPFELVGAPWVEPYHWAAALEERQLPGVRFRPCWFQPVAGRFAQERCGGVQLHVTDREAFRPVATAIHLLDVARRLWPQHFSWRAPAAGGAWPIDRIYGSAALRERLDAGDDADAIIRTWDTPALAAFQSARRQAFLY